MSVAVTTSRVAPHGSHDRAFDPVHRRVHPPAQDAPRASSDRRPHDPEVTTLPAIQSRQIVRGASSRSGSLQPPLGAGWAAPCSTGLRERWLAECEFSRLCRLHADRGIQEKLGAVDRAGHPRSCRRDVRGGRRMGLSSISDCRRTPRQRCRGQRDHEWHSDTAARADAAGAHQGNSGHVSRLDRYRNFWKRSDSSAISISSRSHHSPRIRPSR
jgi:hypothetical protein